MKKAKTVWLAVLMGMSVFCSFSGLEYWPFLSYPMFACLEESEKIFIGFEDEEGRPQIYDWPSYSFVDPFSLTETLSNLALRSERKRLRAWLELLQAKAPFRERPLKLFKGRFRTGDQGKPAYQLEEEMHWEDEDL